MTIPPDHTPFSSPFTGNRHHAPASWCRMASPAARTASGTGPRSLADAGYAVRMPLLPGHGTTWQELARDPLDASGTMLWTAPTWNSSAECDQVFFRRTQHGRRPGPEGRGHPARRGVDH